MLFQSKLYALLKVFTINGVQINGAEIKALG